MIWMFHFLAAAEPFLPISYQPVPNWADRGKLKIQVNSTQVHNQMNHPVQHFPYNLLFCQPLAISQKCTLILAIVSMKMYCH